MSCRHNSNVKCYTALFDFKSKSCSKRLSIRRFLHGDPDENNLSTGADDSTVAFNGVCTTLWTLVWTEPRPVLR